MVQAAPCRPVLLPRVMLLRRLRVPRVMLLRRLRLPRVLVLRHLRLSPARAKPTSLPSPHMVLAMRTAVPIATASLLAASILNQATQWQSRKTSLALQEYVRPRLQQVTNTNTSSRVRAQVQDVANVGNSSSRRTAPEIPSQMQATA